MTEKDMIVELRRGNTVALERAISQYSGYVMAVIEHTLGKSAAEEDKEELASDVFVALWKNAAALKADSRLKPWLAVVARNAALNRARCLRPTEELDEDFLVTDDAEVETPVEREEQARLVRQAVDGLPDEDRGLFLRHYFWHQSIADIAAETGMNPSTVKSRLHRGRQTLKGTLTQKGYTV